MLSSMSKPSSSSSSNWLDRLRSSKGFPLSPDLDLDHFLLSSNPNPNPTKPPKYGDHHLAATYMSDVLSDLFVINNHNPPKPPQKTSRKQPNPRNHVAPPPPTGAVSPSSADNSVAEAGRNRTAVAGAKVKLKKKKKKEKKKKRESHGPAESDLAGFSRTEVTVIDTSSGSPWWRSEKVVFRKGLVWKVREKKVRSFERKKRKVGSTEKVAGEKEKSVTAPATVAEEEEVADKGVDSKDTGNEILRPRRRPKFLRSPRVLATKHPSGFRLEAIGTSRKSGSSDPRSALKAN